MDEIICYSTGCPMCRQLERILNSKGVKYTLCTDENKMIELGIRQAPVLSVNGNILKTPQAMRWALGAK